MDWNSNFYSIVCDFIFQNHNLCYAEKELTSKCVLSFLNKHKHGSRVYSAPHEELLKSQYTINSCHWAYVAQYWVLVCFLYGARHCQLKSIQSPTHQHKQVIATSLSSFRYLFLKLCQKYVYQRLKLVILKTNPKHGRLGHRNKLGKW